MLRASLVPSAGYETNSEHSYSSYVYLLDVTGNESNGLTETIYIYVQGPILKSQVQIPPVSGGGLSNMYHSPSCNFAS